MDEACRWVIKYFSCLLGMLWSNLDHTVVTAAIRQWRRRLSACVQAGGGHFEQHFSHALSILLTNLMLKCAN